MYKYIVSIVLFCLLTCFASAEWKLTFSEEFDSPLNPSIWNVANNRTHCSPCEPQLYLADAVTVEDGFLVITTRRQQATGPGGEQFAFTSGWIDTQAKWFQAFGLFQVNASLPSSRGAWPAHWLMPNPATSVPSDVCWPVGGEIDIMEYAAQTPYDAIAGTYRWGTVCGQDMQTLPGALYPPLLSGIAVNFSDFHVYGVEWNETALKFSVDGNVYETVGSDAVPIPQDAFYWILNTAIAWYYPPFPTTHFPTYHVIDWVRVYSQV